MVSTAGRPGDLMVQNESDNFDTISLGPVVDTHAREEGRKIAMQAEADQSRHARKQNLLANAAQDRIQGHIKGTVRANQGKRDAQQRVSRGEE